MTYRIPWTNPLDIVAARALAAQLCEYACDGSRGRPEKGDPVYEAITEHRDTGAEYSSCADLAHWMLFRLGVREFFINRAEHRGWKRSVNVGRLAWCGVARDGAASDRYQAGDVLVVWARPDTKDAHVTIVLQDRRVDGASEIQTANYGAPGGAIKTSKVTYNTVSGKPRAILGSRAIRRWLPLETLLLGVHRDGSLVDAEDPTRSVDGEVLWRP